MCVGLGEGPSCDGGQATGNFSSTRNLSRQLEPSGLYQALRLRYNPREGEGLYAVYSAGVYTDRCGSAPVRPLLDNPVLMLEYSRTLGLAL